MVFEFDPLKSASNKTKHGLDFIEAQALWNDPYVVEFDVKYLDEERILTVGKIKEKIWTAVTTYRNGKIRIISVRRSRKKEEQFYVSQIH